MERWESELWDSLRGSPVYWPLSLKRLPGGGVLDWTCGWWHGSNAVNERLDLPEGSTGERDAVTTSPPSTERLRSPIR